MEMTAMSAGWRFERLVTRTYRKVYNMAYRLIGNATDAEDLTQEAFFRAYRSFDKFHGERPFENWILRIVARLFLDLLRHRRRRVQTVSYDAPLGSEDGDEELHYEKADDTHNPERVLMDSTLSEGLDYAISRLTPEQKAAVELADVNQMPYQDVADALGVPVGTVRSRLHRSHRAMYRSMSEWEKDNSDSAGNLRLCKP
jgi:RNA polymerase sigma-70 factor (ECF subfamily)